MLQISQGSMHSLMLYCFFSMLICFSSCAKRHNEYDSKFYAKRYCDCYTGNVDKIGMLRATNSCDSILMNENRYYRAFRLNMVQSDFFKNYPQGYEDSTILFINRWYEYLSSNCKESITEPPKHHKFK